MKNNLKITLLVLIFALTTALNAQLIPLSIGIKGGINTTNISSDNYKGKTGFNAGVTVDVDLIKGLSIFTGLEVNSKGAKTKAENSDLKINAVYLHLPLHIGYGMNLLPGLRAHIGVGPYFAHGIGGQTKGTMSSEWYDEKTFDDRFRKFDWGIGFELGIVLVQRIQLRVGYDHGLKDVGGTYQYKDEIYKLDAKNRSFYLSAGVIVF